MRLILVTLVLLFCSACTNITSLFGQNENKSSGLIAQKIANAKMANVGIQPNADSYIPSPEFLPIPATKPKIRSNPAVKASAKPPRRLFKKTFRTPSNAATHIVGRARVIDSDTISINRRTIHLYGIVGLKNPYSCRKLKKRLRCGNRSAAALASKIGKRTVTCGPIHKIEDGRIAAVCSASGQDLNAWLVSEGWAWEDNRKLLKKTELAK